MTIIKTVTYHTTLQTDTPLYCGTYSGKLLCFTPVYYPDLHLQHTEQDLDVSLHNSAL